MDLEYTRTEMMASKVELPLIDLSSPDRLSVAKSIRQACIDCGFFYLINHGIDNQLLSKVFEESKKFFSLPLDEKMKLERNDADLGYSPMLKGAPRESFYFGPGESCNSHINLNQWPPEDTLPHWRDTMEMYHRDLMTVAKRLSALIALALNLDDQFFEKIGAIEFPMPFVRLLHYPGEIADLNVGKLRLLVHSDYGMITLLATDGVPGLQICREKDKQPRLWEDVLHVEGAFIVNVGDLLERWSNCLFRSTLHRVLAVGQERYSVAFFFDPNYECLVECLESCCSEISPPRFPPVKFGDYFREKLAQNGEA